MACTDQVKRHYLNTWLRHQMETFSALLALCAGNSPVTSEFPAERQVVRSFDVFFDLRLHKRLSKQSWGWWFETLSHPSWRHCNEWWTSSVTHTSVISPILLYQELLKTGWLWQHIYDLNAFEIPKFLSAFDWRVNYWLSEGFIISTQEVLNSPVNDGRKKFGVVVGPAELLGQRNRHGDVWY